MHKTMKMAKQSELLDFLQSLYIDLNVPELIHPDPLEFLWRYSNPLDIEIVGFLSSALAFGRVAQILASLEKLMALLGESPSDYVLNRGWNTMKSDFQGFRHRFVGGSEMAGALAGIGRIIREHGSMGNLFNSLDTGGPTLIDATSAFVGVLQRSAPDSPGYLLAEPGRGSACKRLNLFLRWMIRRDAVDPGVWGQSKMSRLLIPLDTHMHRIGRILGFTNRKQADLRTAVQITDGFRKICPLDPVKFDFALTRLGIRSDMNISTLTEFMECAE